MIHAAIIPSSPSATISSRRCEIVPNLPKISTSVKLSKKKLPPLSVTLPDIAQHRNSSNNSRVYKYKLYPGNNSRALLAVFRRRPWWHGMNINNDSATSSSTTPIADKDDSPNLIWQMYKNNDNYRGDAYTNVLLNHIQRNSCLVSKKGLYFCLREFGTKQGIDISTIVPTTFYLSTSQTTSPRQDDRQEFIHYNENHRQDDDSISVGSSPAVDLSNDVVKDDIVWILKPASQTNRGFGIKVVKGASAVFQVINHRQDSASSKKLSKSSKSSSSSTPKEDSTLHLSKMASRIASHHGWIVQRYLERPLLVAGRKFDIRCFVLVTLNKKAGFQGFFFDDVYIRTSSKKFTMDKLADRETHLTNDAVQKHSKTYGKFESGNKLTPEELQQSIHHDYSTAASDVVEKCILPEIKHLCKISLAAAREEFMKTSITNSFELFGYDFMIDENFKSYLIEVNTNPCLEYACPLLADIISSLLENVFRVAVDTVCPPPRPSQRTKACQEAVEALEAEPIKFKPLYP